MNKLLEQHFDNYMNQPLAFRTWFNSHHLNTLKGCGYNAWSSLPPVSKSYHYNKLISHQNQYAKLHAALIKADDKDGVEFYSQMISVNAMRVDNLRRFVI